MFYISKVQYRVVIVYGKWSWAEEKYWKLSFMCKAIGLELQRNYSWLKKTRSHAGNLKQRALRRERERGERGEGEILYEVFEKRKPNFCMWNDTYDNGLVIKKKIFLLSLKMKNEAN